MEQYVRRAIDADEIIWFPLNKAIRLDQAATEEEETFQQVAKRLDDYESSLARKLSEFQTNVNRMLEQVTLATKQEYETGKVKSGIAEFLKEYSTKEVVSEEALDIMSEVPMHLEDDVDKIDEVEQSQVDEGDDDGGDMEDEEEDELDERKELEFSDSAFSPSWMDRSEMSVKNPRARVDSNDDGVDPPTILDIVADKPRTEVPQLPSEADIDSFNQNLELTSVHSASPLTVTRDDLDDSIEMHEKFDENEEENVDEEERENDGIVHPETEWTSELRDSKEAKVEGDLVVTSSPRFSDSVEKRQPSPDGLEIVPVEVSNTTERENTMEASNEQSEIVPLEATNSGEQLDGIVEPSKEQSTSVSLEQQDGIVESSNEQSEIVPLEATNSVVNAAELVVNQTAENGELVSNARNIPDNGTETEGPSIN